MAFRLFEKKEHAALYAKYMIRENDDVRNLILSYLEEKKGQPFGLAVDIGCGTGQSTRFLGPYFQQVTGVDISDAQIQEAKRADPVHNVSYMVAAAEHLPLDNDSVDLITASVAAHWFNIEEFLSEVDRVLKPKGCLALYCLNSHYNLQFKGCSENVTDTFNEAITFLMKEHGNEKLEIMRTEYKEIFDAVPYTDKTRVTKISQKQRISIAALIGFVESSYLFQIFFRTDEEAAKGFLQSLQKRLLMFMGASSTGTEIELSNDYFCVLACKPA